MRRKGRKLTDDDLSIWRQVTKSTSPIRKAHQQPKPVAPPKMPDPEKPRLPTLTTIGAKADKALSVRLDLSRDAMEQARNSPVRMDHRKHEKMRRGKMSPDARIDLHGMTVANAHAVLTSFLLSAHGRGDRLVLVITGKGRAPDVHHGSMSGHKGVLRQSVPRWLALAPLAQIVLQVAPASQRHGGEGAYYVYLKRHR